MAKRKKKNKKNPGAVKARAPQDSAVLMQEQQEALAALRGRRASALGEKIFADEAVPESERRRALAVGHEAYLRELLTKGHTQQVQVKALKLVQNDPWLAERWALSFQVRLGLVDDLLGCLENPDWQARLRAELVDPEDLCEVEANGLGAQAKAILAAWALMEQQREAEALERLKEIGRRSPLVDWRLFLQVLAKARQNAYDEAESILARMLAGCPARAAAERVLRTQSAAMGGVYGRRLKALEKRVEQGVLKTAGYPQLQTLVKTALAENRPGLAMSLTACFLQTINSQQAAARFLSSFERLTHRHFNLERLYIREAMSSSPYEGLLQLDIIKDARRVAWAEDELPRIWIRFFEQARRKWDEIVSGDDFWDLGEIRDSLLVPLLDDCRRLAGQLPDCREVFEFWVWAERECKAGTEAVQAYAQAFPDDPEVITEVVLILAAQNKFKLAESWLEKLPEERAAALRQSVLYYRIKRAFMRKDAKRVEQLAADYRGEPLLERIKVCFMRWHGAARAEKRKRGLELVAFDSPWLVLYCAIRCEECFRSSALPVGVKRVLAEDPEAVVRGYLDLLRLDERAALALEEPELYEPLCEALSASGVTVASLRAALVALILRHKEPEEIVYEADGFIGAFKTLFDEGSADDQALAIVLRMMAVYETVFSINFEQTKRSFRVAWSLAEQDETRRTVSRVYSACRLPVGAMPKEPATPKMIDAELKMQRKFKTQDKVQQRFCIRRGQSDWDGDVFNPFEDMNGDEIAKILEPDFGEGDDDPWGEPEFILDPAHSKPFVFSKHPPLMEFDFESVAFDIEETTRGKHRKDAAKAFKKLVEESDLTPNAKKRLMKIYETLLEGA
jgi:hypothetical protein